MGQAPARNMEEQTWRNMGDGMETLAAAAAAAPAAESAVERRKRKEREREQRRVRIRRIGRKQSSGAANRKAARQRLEAAAPDSAVADSAVADSTAADSEGAADPEAADSAAAGSTAVGSTVMGSTAVGSTAVGSTVVGSTAVSLAIARSSAASSLAAGSMASFSTAISFTAANASTAFTPIASAALLSATDDRDPYVEWGSDSGSSGIGHDAMGGYPINSDEEEMREAYLRLEDRAACEQNRVRAEIDAADRTASDAQASARPVAVARLASLRAGISADSDSDWDPDSLVEQMVSDYAIAQLREVIANHRILLGLSLIPVSQLSHSIHNHDRHLELQTTQQSILCEMTGHAVATASIAHAIRAYHSGL